MLDARTRDVCGLFDVIAPGVLGSQTRFRKALAGPIAKGDRAASALCAEGHRALVFSQFLEVLDLARERLERDGQFLASLKAGGVGVNLTAADYVIHLDPWWNPTVEDQATDRAHRIGQLRPVTVVRLVTENTLEEGGFASAAPRS